MKLNFLLPLLFCLLLSSRQSQAKFPGRDRRLTNKPLSIVVVVVNVVAVVAIDS